MVFDLNSIRVMEPSHVAVEKFKVIQMWLTSVGIQGRELSPPHEEFRYLTSIQPEIIVKKLKALDVLGPQAAMTNFCGNEWLDDTCMQWTMDLRAR